MQPVPLTESSPRIAIAGAGIVGLSIAHALLARGAKVTVFDPNPFGRGASWAAAGMLAPAFEAAGVEGTHADLFDLCLKGAAMWPAFATSIEAHSGGSVSFSPGPSLALADSADMTKPMDRMASALRDRKAPHRTLTAQEACALEPALSSSLHRAILLETDGHVDNRRVVEGLLSILVAHPHADFISSAPALSLRGDRVHLEGYDVVIAAAGWHTPHLKIGSDTLGALDTRLCAIKPVGGQMLSVEPGPGAPATTLRAGNLYITPKDTRIIIGASVEPGRTGTHVDANIVDRLLARAARICPGLTTAKIIETWAGVRPATPDHAPLIGATALDGLFVASGHFRNGILLAPITAKLISDIVLNECSDTLAHRFSPGRQAATAA